jgi:ABC-type Fe3+/spermidine/putrescine transport system ATPase subunit
MTRVVLDGVVRRIDRVAVLDGLALDLAPGGRTVVVGPPGAGKTLIARLLAGLDAPDAGEIYFDGRPMREVPAPQRRVGLVVGGGVLWPHWNVAENAGYGLRVRGVSRRERRRRVLQTLAILRVDTLAARRPASLTPLQAVQVALARALAIEPTVLVLDEPAAGLEPPDRLALRDDLRRVHEESGATVLLLTRDPREAFATADVAAVLDLGRVLQVGPPAALYSQPADLFVARYLGPVNVLEGTLDSVDPRGEAFVRTALGRLVGQATPGGLAPGQPVSVVIRPESLNLGGPIIPLGANRFNAVVERQTLLGELREVQVRGPGDVRLSARALPAQVDGLKDGQGLTVSVVAAQVLVLPTDRRAGAVAGT